MGTLAGGSDGGDMIVVCPTTTYMLRAEAILRDELRIPVELVPSPPELGDVCTTAVKFDSAYEETVRKALEEGGVVIKGIYPYKRKPSAIRLIRRLKDEGSRGSDGRPGSGAD
ncbi:MAG: DUF3343 domain-containing protein [bacterium]